MPRVEHSTVINRPVDQVFAFITSAENGRSWQSDLLESKQITPGPMGPGAQVANVRQIMGRRVEETQVVSEWEPYRKFSVRSTGQPEAQVINELQPVPEGTRVSVTLDVKTPGFARLAEPLFARVLRKQAESNLSQLKQ